MLYDKYMKVAFDKERIERVANMQLYQAKTQVKYLSENDVNYIWEQSREEMVKEMLIDGEPMEKIIRYSKFTEKRIQEIAEELQI